MNGKKQVKKISNQRRCYYKRAEYVKTIVGDKKEGCDYEHFLEFSDESGYLWDYFRLDPCPFLKEDRKDNPVGMRTVFVDKSKQIETCVIKTRTTLCEKCAYRADCAEERVTERCSEQDMERFATGYVVDVQLISQQASRVAGDQKATLEPLILHDVRINGRPGRLRVKRHGWSVGGTSKRRPVEVIPCVLANKKETMVLRLMHAVNETYVAYGNKNTYIAEGYGISKDVVSEHITFSAKLICEKYSENKEKRDLEYITKRLFNPGEDLRPNTMVAEEIPFRSNDQELIAVFEISAEDGKNRLVNIYRREEVEQTRRQLTQNASRNASGDYLVTPENLKSVLYVARYDYGMRTPFCGIPPELSYLILLLWKEVQVELSGAIQHEMNSEVVEAYVEYLAAVFEELIEKICVTKETVTLDELIVFERRFEWPWEREDRIIRLYSCFQSCLGQWQWEYVRYFSNTDEALEKWENNYALQATDDQLSEIRRFIAVFHEKTKECTEDTSLQDILNAIWMNQCTVPITGMPDGGFKQSVIGLVNMSRVNSYGIPLPCLKHLLEDGLLSEDPRHRPVCGLYEDQTHAPDDSMYPCYECMRRDILRTEEGAETSH